MQATQTVPAAPAVLQFPNANPAAETVTQAELRELIEFRNFQTQLEARISGIEADLKARLESGATVESGVHIASLKESFRRNVAWKDVCGRLADRLKLNGEKYCARVLAATKPSRTVSLNVS
jgi:hypothetical protein